MESYPCLGPMKAAVGWLISDSLPILMGDDCSLDQGYVLVLLDEDRMAALGTSPIELIPIIRCMELFEVLVRFLFVQT